MPSPPLLRSVDRHLRRPLLAPLSLEILVRALVERYPAHTIPLRIKELTENGYLTRAGGTRTGWLTPKGAAALARSASGGAL